MIFQVILIITKSITSLCENLLTGEKEINLGGKHWVFLTKHIVYYFGSAILKNNNYVK